MRTVLETHSAEETELAGRTLGERIKPRKRAFVAFTGEMGVGKTAFTRGVCAVFGIERVKSPTYTVVNEYRGGKTSVFHFDLYRLSDADDLTSVGYDDYLARDGIVLCEWSERIPEAIPEDAIRVQIERTDDGDGRRITITENDE